MPLTPEEIVHMTKLIDAEVERQVNAALEPVAQYQLQMGQAINDLANLVMSRTLGNDLPETVARFWRDAVGAEAVRLGIVSAVHEPVWTDEAPDAPQQPDEADELPAGSVSQIQPRPRRRG